MTGEPELLSHLKHLKQLSLSFPWVVEFQLAAKALGGTTGWGSHRISTGSWADGGVPKPPEGNLNWPSQLIPSLTYTGEGSRGRERNRWDGRDSRSQYGRGGWCGQAWETYSDA